MFLDLIQLNVFELVGLVVVDNPFGNTLYFSLYLCAAQPSLKPRDLA
jgi:hypothetical protein